MAFPLTPLDLRAELALPGWTDISSYAYQREGTSPPVVVKRGRPNEQASPTPTSVTTQFNNRDGRFSIRNPSGPWYGVLTRNTPLRLSVPGPGSYLRIADDQASGVSCPGSSGLTLPGDIDVRIDMQLDNWQPCFLAGQMGATLLQWGLLLNGSGCAVFAWYDGTAIREATSTMPVPLGRSMIRAYFDPAAASGAAQVLFYTAATMSATQSQLGNAVPIGAGDFAQSSSTPTYIGYSAGFANLFADAPGLQGAVYEARVYNGSGTLVANPVFTAQADGATSLTDSQGNTWTCSGSAAVSSRSWRAHAELTTLPQRWDPSGTDFWVPVQASGVLRRIQQGNSPLPSAQKRGITSNAAAWNIVAYWPGEDSQGSTQIASGLPGGLPMQFSGAPAFQATAGSPSVDSNFPGSAQLAQVQSSTWRAVIPVTPGMRSSQGIVVQFDVCIPSSGITGTDVVLVQVDVGGGNTVLIGYSSGSNGTLLAGYTSGGVTTWQGGTPYSGANGQALLLQMVLFPGPGGMSAAVQQAGAAAGTGLVLTTGSTPPISYASSLIINPAGANWGATSVGHMAVGFYTGAGSVFPLIAGNATTMGSLLNAWQGETAANRVLRICGENGIPARVYGYPDLSMPMGQQPIDTFSNQLSYCEKADGGQLYEPAEAFGVGYRTLGSLCNQSPGLVLTYTAAEIGDDGAALEPEDDDLFLNNDFTASRNNGSSAQVQVTSGPLSVNDPPDGVGDYDSSDTFYHAWDSDNARIAGWRTWLGTQDVERYPSVPLNLARRQLAALRNSIAGLRIGDAFQMTALPVPQMPPGGASQLLYGYTESLGGFWWQFAPNAIPEDGYQVAAAGQAYAESAGTGLATSYSSSATSLSVSVTGLPWITGTGLSIPILIAGELMTITAISGSSSPQALTVVRSVNGVVKAQAAGASVAIAQPPVASLAGNH